MVAIQLLGELRRLRRAVAHAGEDQRVGEAGDAEADAPLGLGLLALRRQRIVRDVDDVVEEAHGQLSTRSSSLAAVEAGAAA